MAKTVKFPTLAQMQLGPFRSPGEDCGCLLFHAARIDGTPYDIDGLIGDGRFLTKNNVLGLNPLVFTNDNSQSNRRRAMRALRDAVENSGLTIRRDRTIVHKESHK